MSTCNTNNKNCCRNKTPVAQPREELTMTSVVALASKIVQQLRTLSGLGINVLPSDINVLQLMSTLQALMLENSTLRGLLDRFGPPAINVDDTTAAISFGPNQKYTLQLSLGNQHERELLAAQFRAAADKLVGQLPAPDQKALPFVD